MVVSQVKEQSFSFITINIAFSQVEQFHVNVTLEYLLQQGEVLRSDIVQADVQLENAVSVGEGDCKVLDTKTVISRVFAWVLFLEPRVLVLVQFLVTDVVL